jgi:hypothetical protein
MNVIRIRTRIESDTLHLPELREMIGKDVEILVLEEVSSSGASSSQKDCSALVEIAGKDLIDPEVYKGLRAASMI